MATHPCILTWEVLWTEEPGGQWFAISSSRESSWLMDWTCNSCISCISTTPSRKSVYFIYLCITDIKIQGTRRRKPMYDSLTMNSLPSHSSSIPTGWKSYILLQTAEPSHRHMRTPSATHPVVAAAVQSSCHVRLRRGGWMGPGAASGWAGEAPEKVGAQS